MPTPASKVQSRVMSVWGFWIFLPLLVLAPRRFFKFFHITAAHLHSQTSTFKPVTCKHFDALRIHSNANENNS
jgi:hypothetical protein